MDESYGKENRLVNGKILQTVEKEACMVEHFDFGLTM
jgi:hypothetical protein